MFTLRTKPLVMAVTPPITYWVVHGSSFVGTNFDVAGLERWTTLKTIWTFFCRYESHMRAFKLNGQTLYWYIHHINFTNHNTHYACAKWLDKGYWVSSKVVAHRSTPSFQRISAPQGYHHLLLLSWIYATLVYPLQCWVFATAFLQKKFDSNKVVATSNYC